MHTSHIAVTGDRIDSRTDTSRFQNAGTLDVLLPEELLNDFFEVAGTRETPNHLFASLLGRYRHRIVRLSRPAHQRLRKLYQPPGLGLQRISFRADADVWSELQLLSLSCHISMSQIMVWLVVWEARRMRLSRIRGRACIVWDRVGTPSMAVLTMHKNEATGLLRTRARFAATRPLAAVPRPAAPD